jgi:hypothetical protein
VPDIPGTIFQEHGGPCTHAIMAARAQTLDPYTLFSDVFTLSTYRYTYQTSMHPVIVRDLEPGPGYLPPLISKKRGRLNTSRIRKQEMPQKKRTKCSYSRYRQEGHNKRSCRTANDNMALEQGEDSDPEVEAEEVSEAIIAGVPIRSRGSRERRRRE